MCGICGIIGKHNSLSSEEIAVAEKMKKKIRHRGPDSDGIYADSNVVLGHQRLAIIDLEHGQQPMFSDDKRYALVFNGEIYNYLELRQNLIQKGMHFKTFSDVEVLLKLLILEGEKALTKLNGMFAFLFYDTISREWIMARDPFGIKPLYFSCLKDKPVLLFASEIKALFSYPGLIPEINMEGMQEYLTFQFCLEENTLFKNIYKIKPGCFLKGHENK